MTTKTTRQMAPDFSEPACCEDFRALSRRGLFTGAVALAGASTLVGSAVVTAAPAMAAEAGSVLVVLSLRGELSRSKPGGSRS